MTKRIFQILSYIFSAISAFSGIYPELLPSLEYKIIAGIGFVFFLFLGFAFDTVFIFFQYLYEKYELYKIRRKRVRIGVSLDVDDNDEIVKYCNNETEKIGLENNIVFESIKTTRRTDEKFRKLIEKENFDLAIWTQKLPQNGRVPLFFTYKNTTDNLIAKIVHIFIHDIQMQEKAFRIQIDSLPVDLRVQKSNITYTALYIVAVCATLFRGIDEGMNVFERLYEELKNSKAFITKEVNLKLKDLYIIKGVELCKKDKFDNAVVFLDKAYKIDPLDQNLLPALTITKYYLGDLVLSENLAITLLQKFPNNEVAQLNVAFFKIKNKKYENAFKHYKRFIKVKPRRETCMEAISFLYKVSDKEPNEFGYIFAMALIKKLICSNTDRMGESTYIEDLKSFINHTSDTPAYKEMYEYSIKVIKDEESN